jgi:predicted MPP superfamily phosphohydrolase
MTGVMINGHYKFNNPVVQELRLNIEKPVEEFDSVRIAVIGDMHLGWMINRKHAKRYVDLIMSQKPNLILFVGDIIDSHIEPILDQDIKDELVRLSAPLGIYSCTGNHEYRYDAEEKIQLLNESGIVMLRDSVVLIDSAIYVVGRDDKVILDRKSTEEIISENHVDMSKPVIILNHTPDNLSEESEARADLALYGHTHHGQTFPGNRYKNATNHPVLNE